MNEQQVFELIAQYEQEKEQLLLATYNPKNGEHLLYLNERIAFLRGELFQLKRFYCIMRYKD